MTVKEPNRAYSLPRSFSPFRHQEVIDAPLESSRCGESRSAVNSKHPKMTTFRVFPFRRSVVVRSPLEVNTSTVVVP